MTQQQNTPIWVWVMASVAGGLLVVGCVGFVMFFGVFFLPVTVNAVAYLTGAGGQGTFTATSTSANCSYDGSGAVCTTTTYGYLDPGHIPASWPGQVYGSFPARRPVWVWGPANVPVFNQGTAIFCALVLGSIQLALAGGIPFAAHRGYRAWRSARRGRTRGRPVPA